MKDDQIYKTDAVAALIRCEGIKGHDFTELRALLEGLPEESGRIRRKDAMGALVSCENIRGHDYITLCAFFDDIPEAGQDV